MCDWGLKSNQYSVMTNIQQCFCILNPRQMSPAWYVLVGFTLKHVWHEEQIVLWHSCWDRQAGPSQGIFVTVTELFNCKTNPDPLSFLKILNKNHILTRSQIITHSWTIKWIFFLCFFIFVKMWLTSGINICPIIAFKKTRHECQLGIQIIQELLQLQEISLL